MTSLSNECTLCHFHVCRQLGYASAEATSGSYFGEVPHIFSMDDVYCRGEEKRIQDCSYMDNAMENCEPYEGAGVICHHGSPLLHVELQGGTDHSGNVFALNLSGYLGPVCDDNWGNLEANVVCR